MSFVFFLFLSTFLPILPKNPLSSKNPKSFYHHIILNTSNNLSNFQIKDDFYVMNDAPSKYNVLTWYFRLRLRFLSGARARCSCCFKDRGKKHAGAKKPSTSQGKAVSFMSTMYRLNKAKNLEEVSPAINGISATV